MVSRDARSLIAEVESRGGRFRVVGDELHAAPRSAVTPEISALIGENKAAVIAALREREQAEARGDRSPALSDRGVRCAKCGKVDRCVDVAADRLCPTCVEFVVDGCARYTALVGADVAAEQKFGACISCGGSWLLHGNPPPESWRRVTDADDVALVELRYVIASARAIAAKVRP